LEKAGLIDKNDIMNEMVVPDEIVMNKIYLIRKVKVMLDRDLSELYEVKTLRLREQVKRNILRFPENFMLRLTEQETDFMVSHFAIPSKQKVVGHDEQIILIFEYLRQLEQSRQQQEELSQRKRIWFRPDN
jgi:hypothetical protein